VKWQTVSAALAPLVLIASPARSEGGFLAVSTEGCASLRSTEIERILRIELASVEAKWQGDEPLRVDIVCEGASVRIDAFDPITEKRLSREINLKRARADRDRTMALIVSQLFLTSWSEILIEARREAPLVVPTRTPEAAVVREAESAAREATAVPIRPSVTILAGPRVHAFDAPILSAYVGVRPTLRVGRHGSVFLDFGYERGSTSRPLGTIAYTLASASLGAGLRSSHYGAVAFEGAAMMGAGYVDFSGDPTAQAIGSSATGAVAQAAVVGGPTLSLGAAHVGLELAFGVAFPRAVAHATAGKDVTLSGPWTGVGIVVSLGDDPR
jgi:hypothetical protein